ncbi:MAG: hypothetical protein QOJ34_1119 [Pseudonocardiales bacterium]|nr:hypothetical protein [Pseudonocardiales bacterium]
MPEDQALPIVYLRGYAGDQGGVEGTVDDPFYGFNTGSTHIRVGPRGSATFFAFEGPLIRLASDYRYGDAYVDGVQVGTPQAPEGASGAVPLRMIWIHRYYDLTSQTFAGSPGRRLEIEDAAAELRTLIREIKRLTGAPRVVLLGHSTGGLIIRSLLQRGYPDAGEKATEHVDRVFTYGAPHGGIHFDIPGGLTLEWFRDTLGWHNVDDFGLERMYRYLTPLAEQRKKVPDRWDPRDLGTFPPERFFSLVGTDAADYGLPKRAVGVRSDGLVQIESAYVKGGPRAYVHRAHSGRYGLVNSEEGYQNLKRFLFGDVRVEIFLDGLDHIERLGDRPDRFHQAEVSVAVRGLPVVMHEQTIEHYCPVPLEWKKEQQGEPIFLFTLFLIPKLAGDRPARYAVSLAVHRFERREGRLWTRDHLEKIPLWTDNLIVDLFSVQDRDGRTSYTARYAWRSEMPQPDADPSTGLVTAATKDGKEEGRIALPDNARAVLGDRAVLVVRASRWA